jgi:hypothetical protein
MSHINGDTLADYKSTHNFIHRLLKRYYEDQNVTDEELVEALEIIKNSCADSIEEWKSYLGHDE